MIATVTAKVDVPSDGGTDALELKKIQIFDDWSNASTGGKPYDLDGALKSSGLPQPSQDALRKTIATTEALRGLSQISMGAIAKEFENEFPPRPTTIVES